MLQYRGMHATTTSTNTPAATTLSAGSTVNNRYYSKSPPCFGNGLGRSSAPIGFANQLSSKASSSSRYGSADVSSSQIGAFHSSSSVSLAPLVIGGEKSIQQLGNVEEIIASGSWATKAGALILGAAAAGSLFLGPIDRLRGGNGGGGGGGGGDPTPGGNSGGGGGGTFQHKFESHSKEDEDEKAKLEVGVTTAPRPYEVS